MLSPEKMSKLTLLWKLILGCTPEEAEYVLLQAGMENFKIDDPNDEIDENSDGSSGDLVDDSSGVVSNYMSMDENSNGSSGSSSNKSSNSSEKVDWDRDESSSDDERDRDVDYDQDPGWVIVPYVIKENELQDPLYLLNAQLAIEDLQIKTKSKYVLEKIISGIVHTVMGKITILNLKLKDQQGKSFLYEAEIYAYLSPNPQNSKLEISGEFTNDIGRATVMEI